MNSPLNKAFDNGRALDKAATGIQAQMKMELELDKLKQEEFELTHANEDLRGNKEYGLFRKNALLKSFGINPSKQNLGAFNILTTAIIEQQDKNADKKLTANLAKEEAQLSFEADLLRLQTAQLEADDNEQRRLQTQIDELEKINLLLKEGCNLAEAKARAAKGEADELLRQRKENEKKKNLRSIAEDTNKSRWSNIVNDYVVNRDFGQGYEEALIKQQLVNMGIPESQWKDYVPAIRKQNAQKQKANALRLSNSYTGVAESNYSDILRLMGRSKQANRYDALVSARNDLGTNLTKEQTNWVNKMSDLQYEIKNFKMPEQKDASIVTNDLASRGGFSESVRVSYHDNSAKILQACRELVNLSRRNNELQKEKKDVF